LRVDEHPQSLLTCNSAYVGRPDSLKIMSASLPILTPTLIRRLEWRPVVCSPEQLRLHRALEELGWTDGINEFNDAVRLTNPFVTEPILITANGTILAGFGRWRAAVFDGRPEINCTE
jgi:hypothetical protein